MFPLVTSPCHNHPLCQKTSQTEAFLHTLKEEKRQEVRQTAPLNSANNISLRPFIDTDGARVYLHMSAQQCADLAIEPITTRAQIKELLFGYGSTQKYRYAVVHEQEGLVGGVTWGFYIDNRAYISYWVFPLYQRKGYAKKAVSLLLEKIRQQGVTQVFANVFEDNLASLNLLKYLGFTIEEGSMKRKNGRPFIRLKQFC